jgi:hypothetical protein
MKMTSGAKEDTPSADADRHVQLGKDPAIAVEVRIAARRDLEV